MSSWPAGRSTTACRPTPRSGSPTTDLADHLTGGSERAPRRRLRLLTTGLVGLAVLLYAGDRVLLAAERDRLLSRIAAAEATADYADARITATVQYASPQLGGAATTGSVRRSLERLVQEAAAAQVEAVATARATAVGAPVVPWHRALSDARAVSGRYLELRLARLRAGSTDIDVLLTPYPAASDAREAARTALSSAGIPPAQVQAALGPP